jgi:hypothetical protein
VGITLSKLQLVQSQVYIYNLGGTPFMPTYSRPAELTILWGAFIQGKITMWFRDTLTTEIRVK